LPVVSYRRSAWLFTRGEASVTMTVSEEDGGLALVVRGPEAAGHTYRFNDMTALLTFASAHEQRLLEAGFQLQAVAERRTGTDRRQQRRPGEPDRRRSPSR
jgi:hypothetical protein